MLLDKTCHNAWPRLFWETVVISALAVALRAVFWSYTGRMLDDALIACLHSENAVRGLGLTHYVPEHGPVCAFTSPFAVLVALIGDVVRVGWGKHLVQALSIPAAVIAIASVRAIAIRPEVHLSRPLAVLVMGYLAVEPHQIIYGMAGMETQFAVAALFGSIYLLIAWRPVLLGLSVGVCMLIRPEFYLWTPIVLSYGLYKEPRRFPALLAAMGAVWLPWAVFALAYYGSIVPHTVVAKSLAYGPLWWRLPENWSLFQFKRHLWMTLSEQLIVFLSPVYAGHGSRLVKFLFSGPESPLANLVFALAVAGATVACLRRRWGPVCVSGMFGAYTAFFLFLVPLIFHWYRVPFSALTVFLAAYGLQALSGWLRPRARAALRWGLTAVYLTMFAGVLPSAFYIEHMLQRNCYDGVLRQAALQLGEMMQPDDAVGCEPLGSVAYYSRKQVWDWPGIASPKVVEYSLTHPEQRNLESMLRTLKPEYLLLRDIEVCLFFGDTDWLVRDYHPVAAFITPPSVLERIPYIRNNVDMHFRIYKKNSLDDALPYDTSLWPWPLRERYGFGALHMETQPREAS